MGPELDITRILGAHAAEVLTAIDDEASRKPAVAATHGCALALETVGSLNLTKYETLGLNAEDLSLWRAASPEVRAVIRAVKSAVEAVESHYPSTGASANGGDDFDFDAAFDEPVTDGPFEHTRDRLTVNLDEIVEKTAVETTEALGDAVAALIGMMREDHRRIASRLTNRTVIADRWNMLAELQELGDRSMKFLQAMAVTILKAFSSQSPEELLPSYRTDAARAAVLRSAIASLKLEVAATAELLEHAEVPTMRGLCRRLQQEVERFGGLQAYGYLRALDKREFIRFRGALVIWEDAGRDPAALSDAIEGFSKFLEVMRGINRRAELIHRDRICLDTAHAAYIEGRELDEMAQLLEPIYGRDDDLDSWVRAVQARDSDIAVPLGIFERLKTELASTGF